MGEPRITVLMPVSNGAAYLADAIESILQQTIPDFEFLIVDDGSQDDTPQILEKYQGLDSRIRTVRQEKRGLVASLNHGIELARGEYIARMDADDISLPDRLERQIIYMHLHAEVGICGTWVEFFPDYEVKYWQPPIQNEEIRAQLLFESALAHPSVMMRRALFKNGCLHYDPEARYAEDYELWVQATRETRLYNLPVTLVRYRVHPNQANVKNKTAQKSCNQKIRAQQLQTLGILVSPAELELHGEIGDRKPRPDKDWILRAEAWLIKLHEHNQKLSVYHEPELSYALGERWWMICSRATQLGAWTWREFHRSPLSDWARPGLASRLKFTARCIRAK